MKKAKKELQPRCYAVMITQNKEEGFITMGKSHQLCIFSKEKEATICKNYFSKDYNVKVREVEINKLK